MKSLPEITESAWLVQAATSTKFGPRRKTELNVEEDITRPKGLMPLELNLR